MRCCPVWRRRWTGSTTGCRRCRSQTRGLPGPPRCAMRARGRPNYWRRFFHGVADQSYLAERVASGETHARIGLPLRTDFAGVNYALHLFCGS
ncbi:protoglobin domain-containing protein [Chromobacterium sphagni]|uniref:protoglobin domain-containing protein n=1 Tax=Chromobacterium sphagni TaxID=1903179 RepID=UPI001113923F